MARIIAPYTYARRRVEFDVTGVLLLGLQYAVLGGIGLLILLAVVNTVLGAPQTGTGYAPYGSA